MPRGKKRETQSGADAQTVKSVPGQRYGEGKEQQELLRAMPAPNLADAPMPGASAQPMPPGVPVMPSAPVDPAAVQTFLGENNPSLLSGTQQPRTPVTDGLSSGPGRGPEAIRAQAVTPIARYMQQLSADTGNKKWARLAERAGIR
tara:strand:+ start:4844 stop:5281 length:438 start_codon:yes stop_codon:yes gene_type:complete